VGEQRKPNPHFPYGDSEIMPEPWALERKREEKEREREVYDM
jgi:hypothetical protein